MQNGFFMRTLLACLFLIWSSGSVTAEDIASCKASFTGTELTISNSHIERRWRVENGLLWATSLRDLDAGIEWIAKASPQPAPYPSAVLAEDKRVIKFTQRRGTFSPVEPESLAVELAAGPLLYRFQVFPDAHGISTQLSAPGQSAKPEGAREGQASGVEVDRGAATREPKIIQDALENLDLAPQHVKLTQVRLMDRTDIHNELAFEDEWLLHTSEPLRLEGNLFVLENPLTGNGVVFLKEAPLPHARPVKTQFDLVYEPVPRRCRFLGQGTDADGGFGYRSILLTYSGGRAGRIEALQTYQRQLRMYDPKRDGMFLSNTWGDRSRDARINSAFMLQEVEAGARLGVDVIQIDDGWEKGRTANSASARGKGVWTGYWATDPQFWNVDAARFPEGLAPVTKAAAAKSMRFGLWFGPDSSNDFSNWERDANKILELHRTLAIDYFKIDGVKAVSKTGERNLRRFFDKVLSDSQGAITFDLDVTAETRPGYFGMINVGPLFVENRYTDWRRYWPHQTLRNLWKLAQYVDPLRLRMELLNNARNAQQYSGDPLAPSAYSPAYLFATTMMANPLGWFETSNLPPAYFEEIAPLVKTWKQERAGMFSGTIVPTGEAPDGVAWTGFVSVAKDRRSGYALIFRELNASADWTCPLPLFAKAGYRVQLLGGSGTASVSDGMLRVHVPQPRQFLWVKLERDSDADPLLAWMNRTAQKQLDQREATIAAIRDMPAADRRREEVRTRLMRILGGLPEYSGPLNARKTGQIDADGYVIEKVLFESLPGFLVSANVYRPREQGRFPAVLIPAGHTQEGKPEAQILAANLAKKGFVALTYDPIGQGEREQSYLPLLGRALSGGGGNEHLELGARSLMLGQSVARYFIQDARRALDYLTSRADVDANRLGVAGCSGGGCITTYIAALDPRIKAAAPACYIQTFRRLFPGPTADSEMSLPQFLANGLDIADFIEMRAPLPWLLLATTEDYFTPEGAKPVYEEARRFYSLYGAADNVQFFVGQGPHGTPKESREAIYAWMIRWLKDGKGDSSDQPVKQYTNLELRVTPAGTVEGRKLYEFIAEERKARMKVRPPAQLKQELQRLGVPSAESTPHVRIVDESAGRQRVRFETEPGVEIEGTLYLPREQGRRPAVIVVEEQRLPVPLYVQRSQSTAAIVETLVRAGAVVLELAPRDSPAAYEGRPFLGNWTTNERADLIGLNLASMRAHDILRGVDLLAARSDVDASKIRGYARGVKGYWMLYAAASDPRLNGLWLDRMPWSIGAAFDEPMADRLFDAMIPGFALHWDVPDLLTLMQGRRVLRTDPVTWMNRVVDRGPEFRYRYVGQPDSDFISDFLH